ncbi:hypothetical protein BD779DRAFT_1476858 [Infundibulicybe gibba]|nr:hypothetical protein BD779DRAFT_1476858 [Infundibulicybe gibba]
MVDLPYEIWVHVVQFVPLESLVNLLGVNRALFNIYMDLRYRNPLINIHSRRGFLTMMDILADSSIAKRVRTLTLRFSIVESLMDNPKPKRPPREKKLAEALAVFRAKKPKRKEPKPSAHDTILHAVEGMANVNALFVSCYKDLPSHQEITSTAWNTFGHNIQSLTLDVSAEALRKIFPPSLSLPSLTDLTLTISRYYVTTDPVVVTREVFAPLLINHSSSLRSLSIISFDGHFDLAALFSSITTFQNLARLIVCHPVMSIQQSNTTGLERILNERSSFIRTLSLRFSNPGDQFVAKPTSAEWHNQSFMAATLPKLMHLELNTTFFYDDMAMMGTYLGRHTSTLRTLALTGQYLTSRDFNTLFARLGRLENIRSLSIHIATLTRHYLATLMDKMPHLRHLWLKFRGFDVHTTIPSESPGITFRREMTAYPPWEVRELVLPMDPVAHGFATFGSISFSRSGVAGS